MKAFTEKTIGQPAEVISQGTAVLNRMPKLKAEQDLRKKAEAFADGKLSKDEYLAARSDILALMKLPTATAEAFGIAAVTSVIDDRPAVATDESHALVRAVWDAHAAVTGEAPLIDAVTAVTARPNTNQAMRNHGTPPSGSNRWVTSQARPSPAAQEPTRANRSSGLRRPRPERGTGGAASSSYVGSTVAGGGEVS